MRVFFCELRKLWNWKTTAAILALSIVFFSLFLRSIIADMEKTLSRFEVQAHIELLNDYGTVIDRDEIVNGFGLYRRMDDVKNKMEALIIADEIDLFAKNNIRTFEQYWNNYLMSGEDLYESVLYLGELRDELIELEELRHLYDINNPHHNPHDETAFLSSHDLAAREVKSVIHYLIPFELSRYAMTVTILCVICTVLLVSPFITTDRTRKIYQLQYTSAYGRKILGTQFAVVIVSVFLMSLAITAVCGAAYAALNTQIFADASIVSFWGMSFYMYSITYGKYALLLAAMPVILSMAVVCAGFLLSKYSDTYVKLLTKALPLALVGILVGVAAVRVALTNENTVFVLFGSSLPAPEIWVSILLMAAGITAAAVIVKKEKRIDVM